MRLPGQKYPVYDIDFNRMLQVNPASKYERPLRVTDLMPGQKPWRDPNYLVRRR